MKAKKMTKFGLARIDHHMEKHSTRSPQLKKFILPEKILRELKKDPDVWKHFQKFSESYKRIRIGWIEAARHRPEIFRQRLRYFMKMTAKNKKYGMVQ